MILAAALWVLAGLRTTRPVPALVAGAALVVVAAGLELGRGREGRRAGVGALEPRWRRARRSRSATSGKELRRDRVREEADDRPADHRPEAWALLARDDARPVRLGPLAREPDAAARRGRRAASSRATRSCRPVRSTADLDPAGRGGARAAGRARDRRGAAGSLDGPRPGQRLPPLGRPRPRLQRPEAGPALHRLQLRAAARTGQLAQLDAEYPAALDRFLDIGRTRVDPFGVPGRDRLVDGLFDDDRYLALWPYQAMWNEARRLRADARTPYGAVVAIETWLRSTGGFTYDETPPRERRRPAARALRRQGKRGYCQHFAGAMALMLRMLGDPRAGRGRLHERHLRGRRLDRHRPQRARLGRGLVPGLRLAALRPDARTRLAGGRLQRLVDPLQRRRRRRSVRRRRRGAGARGEAPTSCGCSSSASAWPRGRRPPAAGAATGTRRALAARPARRSRRAPRSAAVKLVRRRSRAT